MIVSFYVSFQVLKMDHWPVSGFGIFTHITPGRSLTPYFAVRLRETTASSVFIWTNQKSHRKFRAFSVTMALTRTSNASKRVLPKFAPSSKVSSWLKEFMPSVLVLTWVKLGFFWVFFFFEVWLWLIMFHWTGPQCRVLATGGASTNTAILQVLSDVFNATVFIQVIQCWQIVLTED